MYILYLFNVDDPFQPVAARRFAEGVLRIGRDPTCDWPVADPDCLLSRAHCEVHAGPEGVWIRALGANGVFDETDESRFVESELSAISVPRTLRMGRFRLMISLAPETDGINPGGTMIHRPPLGYSIDVPDEWSEISCAQTPISDGSLLEAFCAGAQIDSSWLSGEPPEEIMLRAGALYRQMVLGLGDLMNERSAARSQFQLTRTTIDGDANNPFKWAPSQRLAIDLLLAGNSSFLSGPEALRASFRELKQHLIATFAGFQSSLRYAVESFCPESIDAAASKSGNFLKSRNTLRSEVSARRYAELAAELDSNVAGSLDRAFVDAYGKAEAARDLTGGT